MGEAADDAIEQSLAMMEWEDLHPEEAAEEEGPIYDRQYRSTKITMSSEQPIEAEVVKNEAVALRPHSGVPTIASMEQAFAMAVRQRELLSDYIKKQLVPGKHFYARGDQKPSLTKEGAEIILLPHSLAPDYELISGPSEPPEGDKPYQITVKCTLRSKGDPTSFVGSGIGSAGSHKGFWRRERGKQDVWDYQPRQTDRYLCYNATVKMAQKSAMIAATINSTAASEFFTQDMEEDTSHTKAPPPQSKKQEAAPKKEVKMPTDKTRKWMLDGLKANEGQPNRAIAVEYFQKLAQLIPGEPLEQLPLRFVPYDKKQLDALIECITNFEAGGDVVKAFEPHYEAQDKPVEVPRDDEEVEEGDEWRTFVMPFGDDKGTPMEEIDKKTLFGWWANYEVTTEFKDRKTGKMVQKKPETVAEDQKFRDMLDQAGEHYNFKK